MIKANNIRSHATLLPRRKQLERFVGQGPEDRPTRPGMMYKSSHSQLADDLQWDFL